jgi:adenylate kinase
MGAQGAGKGTQAERLAPALNLYHLSTGEAFRAAIGAGTELGNLARDYLDRGDLVPDDVTVSIVAAKLQEISSDSSPERKGGALFDGFPRTAAQAEGLDRELDRRGESILTVVEIDVPVDDLVERLSGRRVCPVCGAVYHIVFNPPRVAGICDNDGAELIQRHDDTPDAIKRRLDLYFDMTAPLLEYYRQRGLLTTVNGAQTIDDVHRAILDVIHAAVAGAA